jgi:hypothetical protein
MMLNAVGSIYMGRWWSSGLCIPAVMNHAGQKVLSTSSELVDRFLGRSIFARPWWALL